MLGSLDDPEGRFIPDGLPPVVDSHVHVFPEGLFSAIWDWFDRHAWPIRYRLNSDDTLSFLLDRGIQHVVAFQYAHKPGIAEDLNGYMAGLCRAYPGRVTGMATVFPGEPDAETILKTAFEAGLSGVKLHAHVQCFDMNSPEMAVIYGICEAENRPLVMHAGREPKSPAYKCDPHLLCSAGKLESVLAAYPQLKLCVPHLGVDEFEHYRNLLEKYDTLWLDTAMAIAGYFPVSPPFRLDELRADRVMYGSDFPNIPYAWDRELKVINKNYTDPQFLGRLLAGNARAFFGIRQEQRRKNE